MSMSMTSIKHGVYGGLAGGVVFGALMAMMGMLPMIGNMVGVPSAWIGFFVHLLISATIGGSFAVLLDASGQRGGVGSGLAYGFVWWILGPLTLMPFLHGHGTGRQLERHRHDGRNAKSDGPPDLRGRSGRNLPMA